jgi:hypothetical protein
MALMEQKLLTLPEHLSSPPVFHGRHATRSCTSLSVPFILAITLSALLRYTDYDYPFGIVKLFLQVYQFYKSVNQLDLLGMLLYRQLASLVSINTSNE